MLASSFSFSAEKKEKVFWKWFLLNEDMLLNFTEKNQQDAFSRLSREMTKVHPDLTFEFSTLKKEGRKEFVISAGGMKKAFPAVEALYNTAPNVKNWVFVKFRPRSTLMTVEMNGLNINPDHVKAQLFKDKDKVGIMLFFKGWTEEKKNLYGHIGFLLLDQALGEYDVATKVGFIEFTSNSSKFYERAFEFKKLTEHFDNYYKRKQE